MVDSRDVEPLLVPDPVCPLCRYRDGFRYVGTKPSPRLPHAGDARVWQCEKCLGYLTPDYPESAGRFLQFLG